MNPLNHVAIIMDGNGRWGIKHKKSRNSGHREGLKAIQKIVDTCLKENIRYLTLYTFSTDNWKRPIKETNYLFVLIKKFLLKKVIDLQKKKIKIKIIGERKKIPKKIKETLNKSENLTKKNDFLQINLALNYGSHEEIVNTVNYLCKNNINITKKSISNNLYTKGITDPDILIRTGNTQRLSNFLLWQLSYTEIFFHKKLWPDFNSKDLKKIFNRYKNLKRNYGSI